MKCSGCDSGKEGKCTGYQRRWDFYEWVDAFKGPGVNSLSKMIYWTKIHLFCVTPQKLFFSLHQSRDGVYEGWTEGCTNTPLPWQPCLDRQIRCGGKCGGWVCQEGCESHHSRAGGRAGSGKVIARHWQPHPLSCGPAARCPTFRLPPAESDRKREQGASACFLELLCLEFREELVWQVQIWGFEHQGSFSPALGLCNQKERMGKTCLDWEGSDPDHCTHLIYLDELNQTGQKSDLLLLL